MDLLLFDKRHRSGLIHKQTNIFTQAVVVFVEFYRSDGCQNITNLMTKHSSPEVNVIILIESLPLFGDI